MLEDIKTKGYCQFSEPDIQALVKLQEFTLLNTEERQRDNGEKDVDAVLDERLTAVARYLHQKYIVPTYPNSEYTYYTVWDGVDNDNQGWHTDFMEGYDLFFLYYFDDAQEDTGGAIKGAIRSDIFFGHGKKSEELACYMNNKGKQYALFPKSVRIPRSYQTH